MGEYKKENEDERNFEDDEIDDNDKNFIVRYDDRDPRDLERKKIDNRRIKEKDFTSIRLAVDGVFDERTIFQLRKLLDKQVICEFIGIINAGKEANVYLAYDKEGNEIAVKIYKIDSNTSHWMRNYILGDPRFKKIGKNASQIIYLWAKKEFKNLKQAYRAGLSVPRPISVNGNILVMEYIGEGATPAPVLKTVKHLEDPGRLFGEVFQFIKGLYKARLVHGDLSEFNILLNNQKPIIIDISQGVSIDHPKADEYLIRDLKNVINYFSRLGIDTPKVERAFYDIIEN